MKKLCLIIAFSLFLPMVAKAEDLMIVNAPTASLSCGGSSSRVAYGAEYDAERQKLRDIPQSFDLTMAATPEELKNLWPSELIDDKP